MIKRTKNFDDINQATKAHLHKLTSFDPRIWTEDDSNVALINENKDVALFQRSAPRVVFGHYFFHSRGRAALNAATDMLKEIFTGPYNVEVIQGLTPLEKLGARWLNRKLGFTSHGVTDTVAGPCEIVILTRNEWRSE